MSFTECCMFYYKTIQWIVWAGKCLKAIISFKNNHTHFTANHRCGGQAEWEILQLSGFLKSQDIRLMRTLAVTPLKKQCLLLLETGISSAMSLLIQCKLGAKFRKFIELSVANNGYQYPISLRFLVILIQIANGINIKTVSCECLDLFFWTHDCSPSIAKHSNKSQVMNQTIQIFLLFRLSNGLTETLTRLLCSTLLTSGNTNKI